MIAILQINHKEAPPEFSNEAKHNPREPSKKEEVISFLEYINTDSFHLFSYLAPIKTFLSEC